MVITSFKIVIEGRKERYWVGKWRNINTFHMLKERPREVKHKEVKECFPLRNECRNRTTALFCTYFKFNIIIIFYPHPSGHCILNHFSTHCLIITPHYIILVYPTPHLWQSSQGIQPRFLTGNTVDQWHLTYWLNQEGHYISPESQSLAL